MNMAQDPRPDKLIVPCASSLVNKRTGSIIALALATAAILSKRYIVKCCHDAIQDLYPLLELYQLNFRRDCMPQHHRQLPASI